MSVLVLEVFASMSPWVPLCLGAGAGVLQCLPNVQLWLPGHRGHGWMADGVCSVPKLLLPCCWKGHLELLILGRSALARARPAPRLATKDQRGSLPALQLSTATTESPLGCPSAHSMAGQSLLQRELQGPGRAEARLVSDGSCCTCPSSLSPSMGSIMSLHVCDVLLPWRLGFEVEIKH